jgi:hypothetical protein
MKTSTVIDIEQQGTLDTSSAQALGIDMDGMNIVLSLLSDMYSDSSLAVVREYSCNARDSHVEAGNPDPIIVTLPTALDPQLRVQDFGLGLSEAEILKVYSQYGSSTKRDSNTQIGAFGIGAKSAFAVGNQFMVTGVRHGNKTVALYALNAEGTPTVQILQRTQTDEPNGVLVEIGIEDIDGVRRAAKVLFSTWDRGTVLVDGKEPVSVWDDADRMSDIISLDVSRKHIETFDSHLVVIMGGVPYKVPTALVNRLEYPTREIFNRITNARAMVYINVAIGDVEITPSREELKVTDQTVATVRSALIEFVHRVRA